MNLRDAVSGDEHALFDLIRALARFERLEHTVSGSAEELARHLFGERPIAEAILAEEDGVAVGFALFFTTYSTFLTRPGVYLEDLFVLESHRRRGVGAALLTEVKRRAETRGAGRLEWSVLDWNAGAIKFYERFGATVLPQWRICRVTFDG
ncbi:MAG TPA: GNAT family N-acetyltransferase [Polyangia bacterium]|jgi:GNAT superfamily N-acetyltransferase|nr:GNAT family N-acetyltransferase [Polyangia bacterium]